MAITQNRIAQDAFTSAKTSLESDRTLSFGSKAWLQNKVTMEDVQFELNASLSQYQSRAENASKTRKWLQRASKTIHHYSNVLDVFIQHNPEYVALVWGTMRLLFTSVVNHSHTLEVIARSIATVGQTLPNIHKLSSLYPSKEMKYAIENLYANILEFLLKAHGWINESKIKHIYHSITRPAELEYGDVLGKIADWSKYITDLSNVESQVQAQEAHQDHSAKLRDIVQILGNANRSSDSRLRSLEQSVHRLELSKEHQDTRLDQLISLLQVRGPTNNDLLARIETMHAIQTSAQLNTNILLSEVHRLQVLSSLSHSYADPDEQLRGQVIDRNRRYVASGGRSTTNPFWRSPKLQKAGTSGTSSLITVRGPSVTKAGIQDFSIDVVQALQGTQAAILWVLHGSKYSGAGTNTVTELVKYLTWQARRTSRAPETEKDISLFCAQLNAFHEARHALAMLENSLSSLNKHIYLIIDLAAIKTGSDDEEQHYSLIRALSRLVKENSKLRVKIILLAYDPRWSSQIFEHALDSIIQVQPVKSKTIPSRRSQQIALRRKFVAR